MAANPRAAAVAALVRQEQDGFSNLILDAELKRQKLEGRDKAFASAIFYTVLEHRGTLDYILEQFLPKGLAKLDAPVREILRAALAQARYMQVPVSAAVNEAVKLTRSFKKSSASGLVNAVLRRAAAVDVGQGQSVILRSGTETALVDCGSGNNWRDAGCDTADELLTMGCRRVDRVILTHFDDDHINGVEHLLARMGAETLTIPKAEGGAALDRLLELAERYGMDVETVTEETHLPFGNGELTIFPPLGVSGSNELGLTVLASAGEHDFLITGDMERATEEKLIETYELPELDVLMAGHHGSKNSTSKELLDAVTPGTVIISVGSNSYGHPAEDTLRRLARAGCDIYRTDRHGTVYLSFD